MNRFRLFLSSGLILATILPLMVVSAVQANKAAIMGGNFMTVVNNTVAGSGWTDPVDANPENVVEFRIQVRNEGDEEMERVQVWSLIPNDPSLHLASTTGIRTNNATGANSEVSDTATVNVLGGSPVALRLLQGHSRFFGVTNLYNCPNGCDIPDSVPTGGLEVGNIPPGGEVQLGWKAFLTQAVPAATPAPTPTPAPPAPTPTPAPPAPTPTPAPQGNTNTNNNSSNNSSSNCTGSNSCSGTANVTVSNPAPATGYITVAQPQVAGVYYGTKQLPKTGLPLAAWAAAAFIPTGFGLKRFGKGSKGTEDANYMWEEKQFKANS